MPKLNASVFPKDYSVLFQSYKHDLSSHVSLVVLELRFSVSIFVGSWRNRYEAAANMHCSSLHCSVCTRELPGWSAQLPEEPG